MEKQIFENKKIGEKYTLATHQRFTFAKRRISAEPTPFTARDTVLSTMFSA